MESEKFEARDVLVRKRRRYVLINPWPPHPVWWEADKQALSYGTWMSMFDTLIITDPNVLLRDGWTLERGGEGEPV